MKVFILTEGSSEIGFGHIARCLSLHQAFAEKQIDVEFIIYGDETFSHLMQNVRYSICDWINNKGLLIEKIIGADLVIVDSLIAPPEYLLTIYSNTKVIAFLDDSRRIECNVQNGVIIDWTPFVENEYKILPDSKCVYLLGCPYISLRKAFWDIPDKTIKDEVTNILVTMGGGDYRNITPKILSLLIANTDPGILKSIIIGRGFTKNNIEAIERLASENIQLIYYPGENEMLEAFLYADIVISAGGQTLYELARVGTPTIGILIIDNQKLDVEGWENAGFVDFAGSWEHEDAYNNILHSLNKMIPNAKLRAHRKQNGRSNVDGQGARRIVGHLLNKIEER